MNNEKKKITLFDLLSTIVKRWKLILATTVTITLIMLGGGGHGQDRG